MGYKANRVTAGTNKITQGFTLVEMLVIAPIVILVIGGFVAAVVALTREAMVSSTRNTLTHDIQATFTQISQDVRRAGGFLATNEFTPTSPQGSNDGTAKFKNATSTGDALILRMFTTTKNPISGEGESILLKDMPHSCSSPISENNLPLMIEVVYFLRDESLWRRVVMPSDYRTAGCHIPWQLPSCSPGYTNSFCKTEDELMMEGVSPADFKLTYYASSSSFTPLAAASNRGATDQVRGGALSASMTVKVDLAAKGYVAGSPVKEGSHLRVSRSYANVVAGVSN